MFVKDIKIFQREIEVFKMCILNQIPTVQGTEGKQANGIFKIKLNDFYIVKEMIKQVTETTEGENMHKVSTMPRV